MIPGHADRAGQGADATHGRHNGKFGPGAAASGSGPPHQTVALAATLFAVSMTFLDQTVVAIAAPSIMDELDLS